MAVTITRVTLRKLYPRLFTKIADDEIDAYLARATLQVAAWVTEAAALGAAAWSQFYQDEAAQLYVAVAAARDRLATTADAKRELSSTSQATAKLEREEWDSRGFEKAYQILKAELAALLEKLGAGLPLADPAAAIKGEEDTDPGITWTERSDDPSALANR